MRSSILPIFALLVFQCFWSAVAAGHGTHDERVKFYTAKLVQTPDDVNARHELALAYLENDEWQNALMQLDKADATLRSDSGIDLSVTRARALMIGGKSKEAREVLDGFLVKNPNDGAGLLERARAYQSLKMPAQALADYRIAIEKITKPTANISLEVVDAFCQQGATDEAQTIIENAISAWGNEPPLVQKALDLNLQTGRYEQAFEQADILQKLQPRSEPMLAKKAEILVRAGRHAEARAALNALIQHIDKLPNLERGSLLLTEISQQARLSLSHLPPTH